jgi:hypothetical protein
MNYTRQKAVYKQRQIRWQLMKCGWYGKGEGIMVQGQSETRYIIQEFGTLGQIA